MPSIVTTQYHHSATENVVIIGFTILTSALIAGGVCAFLIIYGVRQYRLDPLQITIFLPAIYVLFAVVSSTPTQSIIEEMFFGMPILMLVGISQMQDWSLARKTKVAIGVWLFHGFYDYHHHWLVINDGVPSWYASFCLLVDMLVALYLFTSYQQTKEA